MSIRRTVILFAIILLLLLLRPRASLQAARDAWARRNWILSVIVFGLTIYLLYGIYALYREGGLPGF